MASALDTLAKEATEMVKRIRRRLDDETGTVTVAPVQRAQAAAAAAEHEKCMKVLGYQSAEHAKERAQKEAEHADMVKRCAILSQRDDLPVDRLPAYVELVRLQEAARAAPDVGALAPGIETAAKWVDRRREEFEAANGYVEPDTGALSFGTGSHAQLKQEYVNELAEIAEGLRLLFAPVVQFGTLSDVQVDSLRKIGDEWMSQDGRDAMEDWISTQAVSTLSMANRSANTITPTAIASMIAAASPGADAAEERGAAFPTDIDRSEDPLQQVLRCLLWVERRSSTYGYPEFIREAIANVRGLLSAAPAPAAQPLFDRKLADLQQRGYQVIGRILHKDGEYALFDSSCRWLSKPQYQRLMHEQDGSLFSTAQPGERDAELLIGSITTGDIEGNEIGDWDVELDRKKIDNMPEFMLPERTYGLYLGPIPAAPAQGETGGAIPALPEWAECQRISDAPEVDEALRGFDDDPTADNATVLVQVILVAAQGGAA